MAFDTKRSLLLRAAAIIARLRRIRCGGAGIARDVAQLEDDLDRAEAAIARDIDDYMAEAIKHRAYLGRLAARPAADWRDEAALVGAGTHAGRF